AAASPGTPPAPAAAPPPPAQIAASPRAAPPAVPTPEPKKVHTVSIRPDQGGGPPADMPSMTAPATSPAARPASPHQPRAGAGAPQGGNAPLAILPSQQEETGAAPAPPSPARSAARATAPTSLAPDGQAEAPAPAAAASGGGAGGYVVQVTSQRSEEEAQSAFRGLQAKYPTQLGGRQPLVRRADLGAKGVFYRAAVGPFASLEEASGVCSNLKAAGGTCIVQRN
ncbi:MAG: SPOR domain-containing protein, partial [Alphaproteobacteria bacterium]|nr:SPOR domain-containing protein [Alphaproteobacteria bacterium]